MEVHRLPASAPIGDVIWAEPPNDPIEGERDQHHKREADDLEPDYFGGAGVDASSMRHGLCPKCNKFR